MVALYSRGLEIEPALADSIVQRTKGASPAFIKELMRPRWQVGPARSSRHVHHSWFDTPQPVRYDKGLR